KLRATAFRRLTLAEFTIIRRADYTLVVALLRALLHDHCAQDFAPRVLGEAHQRCRSLEAHCVPLLHPSADPGSDTKPPRDPNRRSFSVRRSFRMAAARDRISSSSAAIFPMAVRIASSHCAYGNSPRFTKSPASRAWSAATNFNRSQSTARPSPS